MAICFMNVEIGSVSISSIKYNIYFKGDPRCGEETGERQRWRSKAFMGNNLSSCLLSQNTMDLEIRVTQRLVRRFTRKEEKHIWR